MNWSGLIAAALLAICAQAATAAEKISVGYVPNMAFAQLFVIAGEGWDKEGEIEINPIRFQDASMSIQAFGKGEVDVMYTIITSGLIARSKGLDMEVVAEVTKSTNVFCGKGRLAELAKTMPTPEAIHKLKLERKGPVKILNFYRGSISDTVSRMWFSKEKISPEDYVINNVAGQSQFTQAMLSADFDATCAYEPVITIAQDKGIKLEILNKSEEMLPGHATSVLVVRGEWARKNPELVKKIVALHARATEKLRMDWVSCVPHIQKFVSGGMLTEAVVKTATDRTKDTFVSDPAQIFESAQKLQEFLVAEKLMDKTVDLKAFINGSYYEAIKPGLKHSY